MVMKLTDRGLVVRTSPLPGFEKLIPFDEIEAVETNGNGSGGAYIVRLAGAKPLKLTGAQARSFEKIVPELNEILDPAIARPDRELSGMEIENVVSALCAMRGFRPSVLLRFLAAQSVLHRATDLHFELIAGKYLVRVRIDGMLHDVAQIPEAVRGRLIAHLKNLAGLASYRRDIPQEGRITFNLDNQKSIEARFTTAPARGEESASLRFFDALRGGMSIESLGFSDTALNTFLELLHRPRGLILIAGPSSSGKTTAIYSALQYLMKGRRAGQRAVSLEDPIEYPLDCVAQIETAPDRGLTFDKLLSNVLRQDAEVIAIGEIRDTATAAIAIRAALTGHLILSTVHCGSAAEVPRRLINLGLNPQEVAEALTGATSQRLVRVICPDCKVEADIDEAMRRELNLPERLDRIYKGQGCKRCMGTGYLGRTVIAEVLKINDAVAGIIAENGAVGRIREEMMRQGNRDIYMDGLEKVAQAITTLEEIKRVLG